MKVFVRNIPWSASEKDLQDFLVFNGYAGVGVKIVTDRDTGQSRGFGFLTFQSDLLGEKAIAELDGVDFMGRMLQVLPSTSPDRSSRGHIPRSTAPAAPFSGPAAAPVPSPPAPSREHERSSTKKPGGKGNTGFAPKRERFVSRRGGDDYDLD